MADEDPGSAVTDFAALMSKAAEAAGSPEGTPHWLNADGSHKYGTHPDGSPKKAQGRPRVSPSVDELKAQKDAEAADINARAGIPAQDRAPDTSAGKGKGRRFGREKKDPEPVEQFRAGPIAKGVNRLYRKGGKIVKVWDYEVGTALIEITRKDLLEDGTPDPDDVTVGEAWEELARVNPRIRRFLLKVIAGGAWGQLVMAHGPVLLALLMKDSIRKHIPLAKLFQAFFSDEDDEGPPPPANSVPGEVIPPGPASPGNGAGPLIEGLTAEDLKDLAGVADRLMAGMGGRRAGTPRARPSGAPAAGGSPPAG